MVNLSMEVYGRAYGILLIIVYRGPQLVQLMKGYLYRRSPGSSISLRQSPQIEMSGDIRVESLFCLILFAMANLLKFLTGTVLDDISVINASGGCFSCRSLEKESISPLMPSTCNETPVVVLDIFPFRP